MELQEKSVENNEAIIETKIIAENRNKLQPKSITREEGFFYYYIFLIPFLIHAPSEDLGSLLLILSKLYQK